MTRAIVLCAGLGVRLGPLGIERPKPLLPICDVPILRYGIANLRGHGIRDIVINLHHRGEDIERELGDGAALGVRIRYSHEPVILGTGGGIKNALALLDPDGSDEPILSLNGKLVFDVDLTALLAAFADAPDALGMMVVRRTPDAIDWGAVDVAPGTAQTLRKESERSEAPERRGDGVAVVRDILGRGQHMFCGVHVTRPSVVRRLPDGEACMVRQGYLPWIQAGAMVAAFEVDAAAYFAEHSTPARYVDSNVALLRGARLRHPPDTLVGVDATARVHDRAVIRQPVRIAAGALIEADAVVGPDVVVGRGAVVEAGARVERAVIWPGSSARGELRACVVTPAAVVDAT